MTGDPPDLHCAGAPALLNKERWGRVTVATLQGLDRGLRALDLVSRAPDGLSVAELGAELGVHRAIAYRIVETLEAHALVVRGTEGRVRLGAGLATLASRFHPQLLRAAEPVLRDLANRAAAAAFLSVAQGDEECVAVLVAEPDDDTAVLRLAYRVGTRHPLARGAAGIAILALRPHRPDEPQAVTVARDAGFSVTTGELQQGATGIASGFTAPGGVEASVGVVAMSNLDTALVGAAVREAATTLTALSRT